MNQAIKWEPVELNEVVDIQRGFAFKSGDYVDDGHFILRVVNIRGSGSIGKENAVYLANEKVRLYEQYQLEEGDILLVMVGATTGKLGLVKVEVLPALLNQNIWNLKPKNQNLDKIFFYFKTSEIVDKFLSASQGSAREFLKQSDFGKIRFDLPSIKEQQKIAKILTTVDNLIEKTETLIEKYQAIKQGMMHDLFTRGIDSNGQLRPSYQETPHLYKKTELGWIPKEWEVCLLDDVAKRGSGHTPNKNIPDYWNGGIKWVSLADSEKLDKLYIYGTDKQISESGIANSSATKHPAGTVILSRDAGIGKSAILANEMAVSQHFMTWRCGSDLNNVYLYFWLQFNKPKFEAIAMGSTILTIGLGFFKKLKLRLPKKKEQDVAAKIILQVFNKISILEKEVNKYKNIKKGLMQDLLTGKVKSNGS